MANDFLKGGYQTLRVDSENLKKDIRALENRYGDDNKHEEARSPTGTTNNNPFARKQTDGDGYGDSGINRGYTMDDLLNGYVIDNETLSSIDECLIFISSEWDLSDILSKNLTDVEKLISTKCFKATSNLLSSIIDPPRVIYDTLLRLARKIMAVSLVVNNQKMIYVPVKYMNIYKYNKYPGTHIVNIYL